MAKARLLHRRQPPVRPERPLAATLAYAIVHHRWPIVVLAAATGVLLSLIFAPTGIWPLAYVCLVPWLAAAVTTQRRTWMFLISYALGVLFFFFNLEWLWPVTIWPPQGIFGVPLPIGTLLLGLYLGLYFPLAAWLIRFAGRRLRMPLTFAVPVVWTATEFVRAYLPTVPYDQRWQFTGLQWFFLAHSHYKILPMIQIADLVGAYGVSFLIAMINGALVDVLFWPLVHPETPSRRPMRLKVAVAVALAAVAGSLTYGIMRLRQDALRPGPKVAVIQTDEPQFVDQQVYGTRSAFREGQIGSLLQQAMAQKPDIVVLPETMWPYWLTRQYPNDRAEATAASGRQEALERRSRESHEWLQQRAASSGATVVVGAPSLEHHPDRAYLKTEKFNTVFVYGPDRTGPQLYDKIQLVLFGEFIPFRRGYLHRFYSWLNRNMPWQDEYSLTAGTQYRVFEAPAPSRGGHVYRFATPICYEITMSDVCRRLSYGAEGKRIDLLINLSNDGWFQYKRELPQHLAVAVFRAVENRVALARSVNTGISAIVDPKGRILRAMLKADGSWRERATAPDAPLPYQGLTGILVEQVPTDPRITLYMRCGNWLPIGCLIASGLLLAAWWVDRTWLAVRHLRRGAHAGELTG